MVQVGLLVALGGVDQREFGRSGKWTAGRQPSESVQGLARASLPSPAEVVCEPECATWSGLSRLPCACMSDDTGSWAEARVDRADQLRTVRSGLEVSEPPGPAAVKDKTPSLDAMLLGLGVRSATDDTQRYVTRTRLTA